MNFSNPTKRVKWLNGAPPPTRKRMGPDGTVTVEKLNPMRDKRKVVDPAGFVHEVSLATAYGVHPAENQYKAQEWARLIGEGYLPYNECPVATGRIPAAKGDKACEGKFDDEHCCPHLQRVIDARKKQHTEHEQEFASSMSTNQDKMIAAFEGLLKSNAAAAEATNGGIKSIR